jgi:hypothetical protein
MSLGGAEEGRMLRERRQKQGAQTGQSAQARQGRVSTQSRARSQGD